MLFRSRMTVTVSSNGMIGSGDETYAWSFESDRTPPKLAPAIPANWTASARIAGATEPNATVTVAWDGGDVTVAADAQGRFDFAVPDVPMSITLTPGDVGDGAITHVDVETPSAVTGFALDAGTPVTGIASFTGTPVGYATLAVYDAASGLLLGQALTDENGTFSVRVSVPEPSPEDTAGDSATDSGHDSGDSGGSDSGDTADTGGRDSGSGRDTGDTARDSGAR